jgi:serine/threonine protein kinase/formylglycine-generating enzyme required for sulfatase activity
VSDSKNRSSTELMPTVTDEEPTNVLLRPSRDIVVHPQSIGRYRVERLLGEGGFGLVYLAHDDVLCRCVAIKVPHADLVAGPEEAESYLQEARTVANLDHPHIVPVFDVGSTEQFPCFVVSKYVDGTDLAKKQKSSRLTLGESVAVIATVAEALHYAHKQGLVHRDVKPSNILLDKEGKPFVGDFGLALHDDDVGTGTTYAGTLSYMSPEQALGEGHRLDGRSDVFGLGVMLYELLTGRRPFLAVSRGELRRVIAKAEVRPLRQIDDAIPKELERVCLKALSRRVSDRYATARDMADDLRLFLAGASAEETASVQGRVPEQVGASGPPTSRALFPSDDAVKVVPKGLRSFDATDADFFLQLLPGPRDREGLPDSIRFWKSHIESGDGSSAIPVGLIYGPSGCGKSSLMKAGLLPLLAKAVHVIYVESTPEDTEVHILRDLRRQLPGLPDDLGLVETLAALRRGRFLGPGRKVLLVLDQFEQWLHADRHEEDPVLVQALRQCDGMRLQAIVMVRDDFWLAVSRFMQALEVRIREGENSRLVDLFDPLHARKVLSFLGQAYGCLPAKLGSCSTEQDALLDQAVAELAQEGKVISVRLALFAEMMKLRPWVPASLKEVGGVGQLESTFLRETFSATTAPAAHRCHHKAARRVLKALLPESGSGIRGCSRSREHLLNVSGYSARSAAFDELLTILDSELRLITPTSAAGQTIGMSDAETSEPPPTERHYQLTHDYVVRSMRTWLDLEDERTAGGRAALRLRRRSENWQTSPENKQLPSLWETATIALLTRPSAWTPVERRMMHRAQRYHLARIAALAVPLILVCCVVAIWLRVQFEVGQLLDASPKAVPQAIENLRPYAFVVAPILRQKALDPSQDSLRRLHAACALAALGEPETDVVVSAASAAPKDERENIYAALSADASTARSSLRRRFAELKEELPGAERSRAIIAWFALTQGEPEPAVEMTRLDAPPAGRAHFVDALPDLAVWTEESIDILADSGQKDLRSAVCAGLGRLQLGSLPPKQASRIRDAVKALFDRSPDAGTRAAARHALQAWGEPAPPPGCSGQNEVAGEWFVNSLGMTMVRIPAGKLQRAEPNDEVSVPRTLDIASFWLADCEVTVAEFLQFREDTDELDGWQFDSKVSPSPEHPINYVSWVDAVPFLNWLSRQEGLPEFYVQRDGHWTISDPSGVGYRLPIETEWEYACRCGSVQAYAFGDSVELLDRYAVFGTAFGTAKCRSRLPNGWGLSDMHGNVWEWCERRSGSDLEEQVIRGGSFDNPAANLRAAHRQPQHPLTRLNGIGLRVARSISP